MPVAMKSRIKGNNFRHLWKDTNNPMEIDMNPKDHTNPGDGAWETRILCSDESCIGTVGADSKCRVCGRRYHGKLPEIDGDSLETPAPGFKQAADEDEPWDEEPAAADDFLETDDQLPFDEEWENRRLCSDESCIGVIGPDGLCKECGKPYQGR